LLVGVYLAAWKRYSKSTPSIKITKHAVEAPAEDTLKYWTADKMRNAKAVPLPNINALGRGKSDPKRRPRPSRPQDAK